MLVEGRDDGLTRSRPDRSRRRSPRREADRTAPRLSSVASRISSRRIVGMTTREPHQRPGLRRPSELERETAGAVAGRRGQPWRLQRPPGAGEPGEGELVARGLDGLASRARRRGRTGRRSVRQGRPVSSSTAAFDSRSSRSSAPSSSTRRSGCVSECEPSSIPAAARRPGLGLVEQAAVLAGHAPDAACRSGPGRRRTFRGPRAARAEAARSSASCGNRRRR